MNFGVMLVDLLINAQPFPLMRGWYFVCYACLFLIWSVVFGMAGLEVHCTCSDDDKEKGCKDVSDEDNEDRCNYIYTSLNWNEPSNTALLAGTMLLVAVPLLVLLLWVAVLVRRMRRADNFAAATNMPNRETSTKFDRFGVHIAGSERLLRDEGWCVAFFHELQRERAFAMDDYWIEHWGNTKQRTLRKYPRVFLALRFCNCAVMVVALMWSLTNYGIAGKFGEWFVYLTHWTLVTEVAYLMLSAYLSHNAVPRLIKISGNLTRAYDAAVERARVSSVAYSGSSSLTSITSMTSVMSENL